MSIINSYTMFGKPTRVFPFAPNWANPVVENLEWKTDVMRAYDGTEQRRALRSVPRRSFEYSMILTQEKAFLLENLLWNWHSRYFALPVWTDATRLTADVTIDDLELPVNTALLGFRAGDYAIIYAGFDRYEVVKTNTVAADHLTIDGGVEADWPAGTKVYPLVVSHLADVVKVDRKTSAVSVPSSVIFNTSPSDTWPFIAVTAPDTSYDDIEVVNEAPNWATGVPIDYGRSFLTADAEVGPIEYFETELVERIARPLQWTLGTRQRIIDFRNLMGRMQGQAKSVWMPSWNDEFTLAATNAGDLNALIVKGTAFGQLVDVDTSRDRLQVRLPDGSLVQRRIIDVTVSYVSDTTRLLLDSSLGITLTVNQNPRIRLLHRCRLATDKIVIPWLTDSVANPQTMLTTVKT